MHHKEYFDELKSQDIKQRRLIGKPAKCLHDIVCADFFEIQCNTRKFTAYYASEFENTPTVLCEGVVVGFIKDAPKSKLKMSVNKWGLQFESFIKYSEVKVYGEKRPYQR
jgi:hypothetical protein